MDISTVSNADTWKLLTMIAKEVKEINCKVKLVHFGERTRIQNKKYIDHEKAINAALR